MFGKLRQTEDLWYYGINTVERRIIKGSQAWNWFLATVNSGDRRLLAITNSGNIQFLATDDRKFLAIEQEEFKTNYFCKFTHVRA